MTATALLAAGCATSSVGAGGPASAAPVPTGAPIVLGLTNQEGSTVGSFPELREAALAAVTYVNTELGGVHGRPLRLQTCTTSGSPENSRTCAEKIMDAKPIAVIGGADLSIASSMEIYTKANLPYVGGLATSMQQFNAPDSVQFSAAVASGLPAAALFAADTLHAKKVAVIYPNISAEFAFIGQHFLANVLRARGVSDVTMIPVDGRQPDRTPAMMAAAQAKADVVILLDGGAACTSGMQARSMLGLKAALLVSANCLSPEPLRSAGAAAEGVYAPTAFDGWATSSGPDAEVFRRGLTRYAPKNIAVNEIAAMGFNAVMNLYTTFSGLPADQITSEALLRALKNAKSAPNFLGKPYTCDGHMKLAPAVCSFANMMLQVKGGKLVQVGDWIDASMYVS